MSDQYEGKGGKWLYSGERSMGTVTRGDQKSGLHVNVNKSFMPLEAVPVQKGTHPAAHNEAWRSTSDTRDIKETCGAGHAKLQMFVPNALFLIAQQRGGQMALILLPDPHEDESGLSEAELESLRKAQGWLEQMRQLKETEDQVSAAKRNILQAVTLALEEHGVQEEKREGVDEAGAETLLGTFTYDVNKMIAQTFHVQRQLPRTFRYIKFQVESNWGNPEYTCVYRVQVESDWGNPEYTCVYRVQVYRKRVRHYDHLQKELPRTFRYIKFQVESNWGNPEYTCVYRV
ncbi:hypothetical protein Q9966_014377 [Columba livia]|nr:hypothetical protein Q9966_014377 [Columba livia]